jgi:MFS family permease
MIFDAEVRDDYTLRTSWDLELHLGLSSSPTEATPPYRESAPAEPPVSISREGIIGTSRRSLIVGYAVVVFLYWMALYLYAPTLPTYAKTKTQDLALVGVILSMYGFWQMVIRLPVGIAADWLGRRKPFIIGGLILVGAGAAIMGVARGWEGLLIGRAITGLSAATWVPLVVIFSALFPPGEAVRASALLTLVGLIAQVVATSTTGWLNGRGGYSLAFYLAAGVAVVAVVLVSLLKEVHPARNGERKQPSAASVRRLITRRDVLLPSLLGAVAQFTNWATTFGFLPILAQGMGASDVQIGMLVSMDLVCMMLGSLTANATAGRIGGRRLVYASFAILAAGAAGTALSQSLQLLFVAQALIGLGTGISYSVLMGMSIEHVADAERTTAMGLHQSVYAAGMFAGPWLGGLLASALGVRPMFAATAVATLTLGLLGTSLLRSRPELSSPSRVPEQPQG